jgi:hypothetical protein
MTIRNATLFSCACRHLLILFLSGVLLTGCGYRSTGSGSRLAGVEHTIDIPIVVNNSYKPALETRFTNFLVDEFAGRGYRVVAGDKAPQMLKVTVLSYVSNPVAYSAQDLVRLYRAVISAEASLIDTSTGKVVWKGVLTWGEVYPASADIALQSSNEDTAIIEVTRRLSQQIFQNIIQDF